MAKKKQEATIEVNPIQTETITFYILGRSPLLYSSMSEKARQQLLMGGTKKTAVEKRTTLKHDPMREFVDSMYTTPDPEAPTYLESLAVWFKSAMKSAALDLPGVTKSAIGRLVWAVGERNPVWGIPKVSMMVTRSADMNKTPDIRTRGIVPEWATKVSIEYTSSLISAASVVNLLANAGITRGVGDGRPEKGWGSFGQFQIVEPDDPEYLKIVESSGRDAQLAAVATPSFYDVESQQLFAWYEEELVRRETQSIAPRAKRANGKSNGKVANA